MKCEYAVTDKGRNVIKAVDLAGLKSHACWGHALHNLIMVDGLQKNTSVQDLVTKVRKMVIAVRYKISDLDNYEGIDHEAQKFINDMDKHEIEKEYDQVIEIDLDDGTISEFNDDQKSDAEISDASASVYSSKKTLKMDCVTRWNSTYYMIDSIISKKQGVLKLLNSIDSPVTLSVQDWKTLFHLHQFLKSFDEITKMLSCENVTTINMGLLFHGLLKETLVVRDSDPTCIRNIKVSMQKNFDYRFPITDDIVTAAILDPRFKNLNAITEYLKKIGYVSNSDSDVIDGKAQFVVGILKANLKLDNVEETIGEPSVSSNEKNVHNLISLASKLSSPESVDVIDTKIRNEVVNYLLSKPDKNKPYMRDSGNILDFWKENYSFQNLRQLAKKLLVTPIMSTSAERSFSTSGNIITKKRACLAPTTVRKLMFIHDNYKHVQINEMI